MKQKMGRSENVFRRAKSKSIYKYSNTMNDIYNNINDYNPKRSTT